MAYSWGNVYDIVRYTLCMISACYIDIRRLLKAIEIIDSHLRDIGTLASVPS